MAIPPQLPPKPPVKLFVKAGADCTSYGACPSAQRIYIILALKATSGELNFTVHAINLSKPTEEFRSLGLRSLPAVSHLNNHLDNLDEILEYIHNTFQKIDLSYDNILAEKACKDVFSKFCFFIKAVSKDAYGLTAELEKLDKYLIQRTRVKGPFMCGTRMTYLDCELLPKLQQIRVAGKEIKGYEVPVELAELWHYMDAAYQCEAFRASCPSDQEIILHWMERTETVMTIPKPQRRKSSLMNPAEHTYSFDVPVAIFDPRDEEKSANIKAAPEDTEKRLVNTPLVESVISGSLANRQQSDRIHGFPPP